jgi:putative DNA primase/helicase
MGGGGDDGLLQRFCLTVWPDCPREFRLVDRAPNLDAQLAAQAIFVRLSELAPAADGSPTVWRFSSDAQGHFNRWMIESENRLRSGDLHPAVESHLAKYRKLVPALALVFSLIEDASPTGIINVTELHRALEMADYLKSHAERLYTAATHPELGAAVALMKKIQQRQLGEDFTVRDVHRKGWAGLTDLAVVKKAVMQLLDYDWLRKITIDTGGRPSDQYLINPYAFNSTP